MALTRLRLIVRGRVQGVGYRWFAQESARRLGLSGWARNLDDGTVEIEAEGDADSLEELAVALRTGHPVARVDGLTSEQIAARGDKTFDIQS